MWILCTPSLCKPAPLRTALSWGLGTPPLLFLVETPQNLATQVSSQLSVCISGNKVNPSKAGNT